MRRVAIFLILRVGFVLLSLPPLICPMSYFEKKLSLGVLSAICVVASPIAYAVEIDTSSNAVFDLYFFGNGEVAQLGENLSGVTDYNNGLDLQQITGWTDWTGTPSSANENLWTQAQKQAMTEAVAAWTDTIQNVYDTQGGTRRKMRIGFFLDDATRSESLMDASMTGYASYATTTSDFANGSPVNLYSVPEWLWRDGKSATVSPPSSSTSGSFWNYNLLPNAENCIEVAIVINPEQLVYSNGLATRVERSTEDLKKVAMHELGHAMGMDSKMYSASESYPKSNLITTWDSLMMIGDNQRVVTLGEDGKLVYAYENFRELCAEGWSLYEAWFNSGEGEEKLIRLQNADGEVVNLLVTAGTNVEGNSLVHLLGELGKQNDVLGPGGLQGAEFTELDLTALRMLGWQVAIPEPSSFGLLAGLGALALVGMRRRGKKN